MLEQCERRLGAAGLSRYEISSYARAGAEAVHNRRYWQRRPVLGLGVGAFSSDPQRVGAPHGERRANPRGRADYQRAVDTGSLDAAARIEVLTPAVARGETMFLGLRTADGVDAARFADEFGSPPRGFWSDAIDTLCRRGWLHETEAGSLRLSAAGRQVADSVCAHFV